MTKKTFWCALALACLMVVPATAQSSITCGPLDDGRVANVFYKSNAVFFDPVVEYEYEAAVLTISGPCETLTKTFKPGEEIFFDLAEVERQLDGQYEWQLRFMPAVDPGVREELQASRGSGEEDDLWWSFWQKGLIPAGPSVDNASFSVMRGAIIDPNSGEESQKSAGVGTKSGAASLAAAAGAFDAGGTGASASGSGGGNPLATKDFVINDDLIVIGSTCIGFDCVNGEVFSFDTLRFKENNLRIKFDDTSGGSFPTRNWEIEINSSANGGQTHFRVNDVDAGRAPFTIEGNSPSHSLYVDSSGRVGMGTSNPVVELHVVNGDTPALRLDQNTSSGFASQVWDVAGNETSFFVRDATNGSTLPFRIFPGASSNSLVIDDTNNVGLGTTSPSKALHVRRTDGTAALLVEEASSTEAARELAQFQNNGTVTYRFTDTQGTASGGDDFNWIAGLKTNNQFMITLVGTIGSPLWQMDSSGNVTATSFNPTSSRELKEGFQAVDSREVLARLSELPIAEWQYRDDVTGARHIGPTAEDFKATFGLNGPDDKHLSLTDLSGVALVAIQGLHQEIENKEHQIGRLNENNRELNERLEALEKLVASLAPASD